MAGGSATGPGAPMRTPCGTPTAVRCLGAGAARPPNREQVTVGRSVPLSKTMKEQVEPIRNRAFDRAVRASPREAAR